MATSKAGRKGLDEQPLEGGGSGGGMSSKMSSWMEKQVKERPAGYSKKEIEVVEKGTIQEAQYQGKDVQLGKPKRGGAKKFYVYVMNPKTKKVKKVSFGDTSGLSAKINNPKARKAFADRHDCKNKKDKTKAGYWSCRLPRYASLLGLKGSYSGFW